MRVERHWPEYAIEAALLGIFMVSACAFTVLLEHPDSAARAAIGDDLARRALIGVAMGLTAIALIHSPWGQRSGAHFNPATTITFYRLGKIETRDAVAYVVAQCVGGIVGVQVASAGLGMRVAHPSVRFVATTPGAGGELAAFAAEAAISFLLMGTVLLLSNGRHARFTGLASGALVAAYITFEAPLSGMSMNPARTLGSAFAAGEWRGFWIYGTAPVLGMLAAAELYLRARGVGRVYCAKLLHQNTALRCIFRCRYDAMLESLAAGDRCAARRRRAA